jgi:hypothetical protein
MKYQIYLIAIIAISFNSCNKKETGKYNLMLLDENLKEIKKAFFPQKEFINATFASTFITNESGQLFFIYPSSNIVHELYGDTVLPFMQIDFGDRTMPYDKIIQLENRDDYSKLIGEKTYLGELFNYKITNQSFFFSFRDDLNSYYRHLNWSEASGFMNLFDNREEEINVPASESRTNVEPTNKTQPRQGNLLENETPKELLPP